MVAVDAQAFVLQAESTGTEYGSTYHDRLLSCVKKEHYYRQRKDLAVVKESKDEATESEDLLRGTYYHLLQKCWRQGTIYDIVFPDHDAATVQMAALREACRQFAAYRRRFPDGLWPTVSVEDPLGVSNEERQKLGTLLPHVLATGQLDLVTDVTEENAASIGQSIGQFLVPGRYIIDYKTGGYFDEKKLAQLKLSLQGRMYMVLHRILRPEPPVVGVIYDCISGHADATPKYPKGVGPQSYFSVKYLEPSDEAFVLEYWDDLAENRRRLESGDLRANKAACFNGYKVCPYLTDGTCNQMHEKVSVNVEHS